jgi:predicted RNase H-like HicB family nuclease
MRHSGWPRREQCNFRWRNDVADTGWVGGRRAVKDYHINIFYSDEDGGYIADIPDLKACSAFGATAEEALREVELAKSAWLEAARAEGKPIRSIVR